MIVYRPNDVFESTGELETALSNSATLLLSQFKQICESIRNGSDPTDGFPALVQDYMQKFKAWKVADETQLALRLKIALAALYQALPLTHDPRARTEINTQIERLRSKYVQIKGADEMRQFDEDRLAGVQFPAYRRSLLSSNEQLAHELLLNPAYEFKDSTENDVPELWSTMEAELLGSPPSYVLVRKTLEEVRSAIRIVSGNDEIDAVMDIGFINTQPQWDECVRFVEAIVGVIQRFQTPQRDEKTRANWEGSVLPTLRHATTAEQPRVFCQTLKFLMDWANGTRTDIANERIRYVADIVQTRGPQYERDNFQSKLDNGWLTLQSTEVCVLILALEIQKSNSTPPLEIQKSNPTSPGMAPGQCQPRGLYRDCGYGGARPRPRACCGLRPFGGDDAADLC